MPTLDSPSDHEDARTTMFVPSAPPPPEDGAAEDVYDVEQIVAEFDGDYDTKDEERIKSGKLYLIKWVGYDAFQDYTWEEPGQFREGAEDILRQWDQRKLQEQRGLVPKFDLEAFNQAVYGNDEQAESRERPGELVSSDEARSQTDSASPVSQTNSVTHDDVVGTTSDTARASPDRRHSFSTSSSDSDTPIIFAKKKPILKPISKSQDASNSTSRNRPELKRKRTETSAFIDPRRSHLWPGAARRRCHTSVKTVSSRNAVESQAVPNGQRFMPVNSKPVYHMTLGKNIFGKDWATKTKRMRAKGDSDASFANLAIANRANKQRQNRNVDFNAVDSINLHTGESFASAIAQRIPIRGSEPKSAQPSKAGDAVTADSSSNMGTIMPEQREPQTVDATPSSNGYTMPIEYLQQSSIYDAFVPITELPDYTCYYWANTPYCSAASQCAFAHQETGLPAPRANHVHAKEITCLFWYQQGRCGKSASVCRFAHAVRRYLASTKGHVTKLDLKSQFTRIRLEQHQVNLPREQNIDRQTDMQSDPAQKPTEVASRTLPVANETQSVIPIVERPTTHAAAPNQALAHKTTIMAAPKTPSTVHDVQPEIFDLPVIIGLLDKGVNIGNSSTLELYGKLVGLDKASYLILTGEQEKLSLQCSSCINIEQVASLREEPNVVTYAYGDICLEPSDSTNILIEQLELRRVAAFTRAKDLLIVVYSTKQESEASFREELGAVQSSSLLRYRILAIQQQRSPAWPFNKDTSLDVSPLFPDLSIDRLITWDWESKYLVSKVAFICSGPSNEEEVLNDFLRQNDVTIYTDVSKESWQQFIKKYNSGILFFPQSFRQFHCVEHLSTMTGGPAKFNVFSYGFETSQDKDLAFKVPRLFPRGQAIYIMDDCFIDHAHDTREVVNSTCDMIRKSPLLRTSRRILGRPNLLEWLKELVDEETTRIKKDNTLHPENGTPKQDNFVNLHSLVVYHRDMPEEARPLVTPDEEIFRAHSLMWEMDQVEACSIMAAWFSMWAEDNANRFRKFITISMMSSEVRETWKRKYQHLQITTPSAYMSEEMNKKLARQKLTKQ